MKFWFPVIAYFIGAIPTAYVIVKILKGIDIRTVGSGNVGATNAGRVLGFKGFLVVFIIDMLKGFIPVYLAKSYFGDSIFLYLVAFAAIIGHIFTVFLNFKGGKGVATGVGVYIALTPINVFYVFLVFMITVGLFKMVSLGSIVSVITLTVLVWINEQSLYLKVFTLALALFIIIKHRENIKRILNGTEKKIGEKVNL
ncbi:glycerol-3-phosphate 1-O-acyltransferase PlsY [Deferribacter autotrophicus]|uniref:Glycerol-3-phosphate acyltransferase n=1 Tax=Deferribacter autotrophicus TaxID=500465 RepID=A0A5A8F5I2_9BACT|nr:glycerol-3-phosphate 1-O-acyltransferase PlsY [Deferribacter autotrophicus]KAA0259317.1 glycerol-3-phosphate 1-O-acyltransferase PlsY [Deferribacter autotrophicus]